MATLRSPWRSAPALALRLWVSSLGILAPALTAQDPVDPEPLPRNVLVLVGDDIGLDRVGAYGFTNGAGQPISGPTPNLDALAAQGVRFTNAWANPFCSPTRATCLTGRYSFRTGIGHYVSQGSNPNRNGMRDDEVTIPDFLPASYHAAALGKWHLADMLNPPDPETSGGDHPIRCGFDYHAGSFANFISGQGMTYERWPKYVSDLTGSMLVPSLTYATTDTVDEAIGRIQTYGNDPWFLWVAFNAPHVPRHKPPAALHTQALGTGDPDATPIPHVKAMIEAMDTEIGRLLAAMPAATRARTTIVFIGDNGTQELAIEPPFDPQHGKGTGYNGGVNVPWIVSGAGVPPASYDSECHALVNTTDIFATVAELVGVTPPASGQDSVSTVPYLSQPALPSIRTWIYAERFLPNFEPPQTVPQQNRMQAIRGPQYKLLVKASGQVEFYDVIADLHEANDLMLGTLTSAQSQEYGRLRQVLAGF